MKPSLWHKLLYRAMRIPYRFQEEGILPTLRSIGEAISSLIYRRETVLVFRRDLGPAQFLQYCKNPEVLKIGLLSRGEVKDLLSIYYASREEVLERLENGEACLIARWGGGIVHYSWLTAKSRYAWEMERPVDLGPGQYYLYNCRTVRAFRRRGVYKAVIARALEEVLRRNGRSITALVRRGNISSRKAFLAVGFEIEREIHFRRIGINRRYKEKSYATTVHTNTTS